jgi:hypothetical protein
MEAKQRMMPRTKRNGGKQTCRTKRKTPDAVNILGEPIGGVRPETDLVGGSGGKKQNQKRILALKKFRAGNEMRRRLRVRCVQ